MKKIIAVLLALTLLVTTGCMRSTRLSKRAVVQAAGFDLDRGEYVATMQLYGLSGASSSAQVITARGKTLTSLFAGAAVREGKQLFLGNLRLVVFGAELAQTGIGDALQFLGGYHQLSPSTQVAVAQGDAADLLQGGDTQPLSSGGLTDTLESAQKTGQAPRCRLMDLMPAGERDQAAPVLAKPKEPGGPENGSSGKSSSESGGASEGGESGGEEQSGGEQSGGEQSGSAAGGGGQGSGGAAPIGAVVFSGGRAAAYLTPEMTRGLCWLQGVQAAVLETKSPLSAAVTSKASPSIRPARLADNVVFHIQVDVRSTLLEAPQNPHLYGDIAWEQERLVSQEVEAFLNAACRRGYDPLGFGDLLRQRMPDAAADVRAALARAGYDVAVQCRVDKKGAAS